MAKLKTKVSNLKTPTRSGAKCTAKWSIPAKALKNGAKDKDRFDGLDMLWVYDAKPTTSGIKKGKGDALDRDNTGKEKTKSDSDTFDRKAFYPFSGKPLLVQIEFWIRGYNNQSGKRHYGPWVHKALSLKAPDAPTTGFSYNAENGTVTATYNAPHPDGAKECYQTKCWIVTGSAKRVDGSAYTDVQKTFSYEVPNAKNLSIGAFVKCTYKAMSQGLMGDSKPAERTLYVVNPNPGSLGAPTIVYAQEGVKTTAQVRVPVTDTGRVKVGVDSKKNAVWQYPATLTLQRRKDVPTDNDPASAAQLDGWEDVMSDNGVTNGLTDTWAQGVSAVGLHTWYRLKAERDGYTTLSMPVCASVLDELESSTVAGAANIDAAVPGADGTSVVLTLSGKEPDDEGYEVSWSTDIDAWQSTDPPETFETAGSTLVVKKLTNGTRYYFKARAYDTDADGNYVYGDYSGMVERTPVSIPSTVVLLGDSTVARGSALQLSWTYDTDAQQRAWRLVDENGAERWGGEESTSAFTVTPDDYGDDESISLHVEVTTGGDWAKSEQRTFTVADAPTCSVTCAPELTAQPLSFTVASDTGDTIAASVTSMGASSYGLDMSRDQMEGDTVWSDTITPVWTTSGSSRTAAVALPSGQDFRNGARYVLRVSVIDEATGLSSQAPDAVVEVDWAHTASQPAVAVVPDAADRSAAVTVSAPQDYAAGDRFDLYRSTPDGDRRIATALPFGTTVTDRFAPYSIDGEGTAYVAATVTADGDVCASDDADYSIACRMLRFDWGKEHVELPYNIESTDKVKKDSETRAHQNGVTSTFWNPAVERAASLSTDVIKFRDAEQQEAVRAMLRHAGSVFVRTPDGLAFEADVHTGAIERSHNSKAVGMSFEATEHDLTASGMPGEDDISAPEWGGGAVEVHNGVVYDSAGGFPMDTWSYIGTASGTTYVYDGVNVRTAAGTLVDGWTWDGITLYDENDDPVEVS